MTGAAMPVLDLRAENATAPAWYCGPVPMKKNHGGSVGRARVPRSISTRSRTVLT